MGCDYGDTRPGAEVDDDSDWEEINEVENEAEMLVSQWKLAAGLGKHREDYRTRRDRTELQWKHWAPQKEAMAKAYMTWSGCDQASNVEADVRKFKADLRVTVLNLFGTRCVTIICYSA